jgi:hypothetical protein
VEAILRFNLLNPTDGTGELQAAGGTIPSAVGKPASTPRQSIAPTRFAAAAAAATASSDLEM